MELDANEVIKELLEELSIKTLENAKYKALFKMYQEQELVNAQKEIDERGED